MVRSKTGTAHQRYEDIYRLCVCIQPVLYFTVLYAFEDRCVLLF